MTSGEWIASTISSATFRRSIPSNRRTPLAEEDRRQRERELIDQARVEVLQDGVGASCDPDVLAPAASRACRNALSIPSLTKWNVVPPGRSQGRADLVGQDEDRRMEGGFLGPERARRRRTSACP